MNARLAALLTAAHAPGWRRRYGAEFCALLEELPGTPAVIASATASALSTHGSVLVTAGAFALAAAVLALGPAASDRRTVTAAHTQPTHASKRALSWEQHLPCDTQVSC
jgi:hypothetical protein